MDQKKSICFLVGEFKTDHNLKYVEEAVKAANHLDYVCSIFSLLHLFRDNAVNEEALYSTIDFNQYSGVVLVERTFFSSKKVFLHVENLLKEVCTVPVVVLGITDTFPDYFSIDNGDDYETLTDHMIEEHNCRKIYCLGGDKRVVNNRIEGFRRSLEKHDLPIESNTILYGGYWIDCASKLADNIAHGIIPMPDAVMCINDCIGSSFIRNLYALHIRVPEDIKVCGFDHNPIYQNMVIPITTFPHDSKCCAEKAIARLHYMITQTEIEEPRPTKLEPVIGRSCGCIPKPFEHPELLLNLLRKREEITLVYQSGNIAAKFYSAINRKELVEQLVDSLSFIPDNIFFGLFFYDNEQLDTATCVYSTNLVDQGSPVSLKRSDFYTYQRMNPAIPLNMHIVPLDFNEFHFGYVTVNFLTSALTFECLQSLCNHLAVGLYILKARDSVSTVDFAEALAHGGIEKAKKTPKKEPADRHVILYSNDYMSKCSIQNVFYFESNGKKVTAQTTHGVYETRCPLYQTEETLQNSGFLRISKSLLVNTTKITSVRPEPDRSATVNLTNKEQLRASRNYVKTLLGRWKTDN